MKRITTAGLWLTLLTSVLQAQQRPQRLPIIDMHLHAVRATNNGPPPQNICLGTAEFVPMDPREGVRRMFTCASPVQSPLTDDALMRETIAQLERYNVIGVASGPLPVVERWKAVAPSRIIPGLVVRNPRNTPVDSIRRWFGSGRIAVLGELTTQYAGFAPTDSALAPYFALAEELDIPVALHMGLGPPGAPYIGSGDYRARLSNPLLLEDVLLRHPKMRIYVMHAGWPMLNEMIHLMYTHPQVYVDVGVISFAIPRKEFHAYLRRMVEAGFGSRIMFGSDQMVWPQAIGYAIDSIESADFLTAAQKRDILYNNAARFLRLESKPHQ